MNPENHEYFRNLILERKHNSLSNLGTIEKSSMNTTTRDTVGGSFGIFFPYGGSGFRHHGS